ncbi:MAG: hypothetical protein E2O82_03750 [Betaproteobacteria bacterium]|nr:MAG: hypothetical protein E2O82_03750 [Betaproteobacteria bacterium]
MLIDNKRPTTVSIGSILLVPGINSVDDGLWDTTLASKSWAKPIKGLIKDEQIKVMDDRKKLTIEMVKNTVDENLLSEWLANPAHKGPLRGAIKTQIEALELVSDED